MPGSMDQAEVTSQIWGICQEFGAKLVRLQDKPEETVEATVRSLWLRAAGFRVSARKAMETALPGLTGKQLETLKTLLAQRLDGKPLGHLTERQSFMGLEFICSKDALIPRKESELLANAALDILREQLLQSNSEPRVLDLCCGCGNIACSLASRVPSCAVFATDLSIAALDLAKSNARELGCAGRVEFYSGDLFDPFESEEYFGAFDLITCNPPYISTGKLAFLPSEIIEHEPRLAFDGGPLGIGVLWRVFQEAPRFLNARGWLVAEVGLGQGEGVLRRLSKKNQFTNAKAVCDVAGNIRTVLAQLN